METIINEIVDKLKTIGDVDAIVLGGSRASGTNRPDSDVDLGIYYSSSKPLDIEGIRK